MLDSYIGEIALFPYTFAPRGWAFCNGQLVDITQNTALFAVIGIAFGGNGVTNFALPDLQQRTAIGTGTGPGLTRRYIGDRGGSDEVTLTEATMAYHTHAASVSLSDLALNASPAQGTVSQPSEGAVLAAGYDDTYAQATYDYRESPTGSVALSGGAITTEPPEIHPTGGGDTHENRMPSLGMNFCICLQGEYPPRS